MFDEHSNLFLFLNGLDSINIAMPRFMDTKYPFHSPFVSFILESQDNYLLTLEKDAPPIKLKSGLRLPLYSLPAHKSKLRRKVEALSVDKKLEAFRLLIESPLTPDTSLSPNGRQTRERLLELFQSLDIPKS
jgi:hypothetical protein